MGNVTNSLNVAVTTTRNSDQSQVINDGAVLAFDSSVALGLIAMSLAAGANPIALPKALCYQLFIRNTDPSYAIQVTITTPVSAGGAPPVNGEVQTWALYPGDVLIVWQNPTSKNVLAGFSELSLFTQGNNGVLCEYFIGA